MEGGGERRNGKEEGRWCGPRNEGVEWSAGAAALGTGYSHCVWGHVSLALASSVIEAANRQKNGKEEGVSE